MGCGYSVLMMVGWILGRRLVIEDIVKRKRAMF